MADCRGRRIGVLIVAYNAVTTLKEVLDRIPRVVWDNVEQVVVADDASQDATYELAVGYKALAGFSKLHVVRRGQNLGYGGNQKAGYRYLLERGFDVVVLLHGDGQYAPERLADLYGPIVRGEADAVFGSRMMPDFGGPLRGGMPLYKYLGNRILTRVENRLLGLALTEFHSGYRAYSLHALRQIDMSAMTDDFHFDTEIIVKLHHQGFRIVEVPIPTYYGTEICYVNGIKYAADVLRAVNRYRRTLRGLEGAPEFAEYLVRYPVKTSAGSSHTWVERVVGGHRDVLELGCGDGWFSERLAEHGNCVTGVDLVEAPRQASVLADYIRADLATEWSRVEQHLDGRRFDVILAMDVLEHLAEPAELVRRCRAFLRPGGVLVVSVPNVANITVRAALLFGRFEYASRGILDRGHVRFFTRRSARHLLETSGYRVMRETMTVMPIDHALGLSAGGRLARALNGALRPLTWMMPGLLGYQYVGVARKRCDAAG
jgi:2-polyprenyl-3-methyl-5-hydroxy-6-metoxy-1,4-benzoquinol methylase